MYGGDFDGSAVFSGGGFMPSQATQASDSLPSHKRSDVRVLLPLTIKQLSSVSSTSESNFSIDGVDLSTVVIVGRVCNILNKLTQFDVTVDDGTGCFDCIKWVHERVDTEEMELILPGTYVRVHGNLKSFQGKRTLNAFSIRPLTDFNEITYHFIDCMYVHLYNTRIRGFNAPKPEMTYSGMAMPTKSFQTGPPNQFSSQFNDGLQGISQVVLNYLNQPSRLASETGVHCDIISRDLRVPVDKVRAALELLASDGFVYSTTDDFCYKSTANA